MLAQPSPQAVARAVPATVLPRGAAARRAIGADMAATGAVIMGIYQPLFSPALMQQWAEKGYTVFSLDTIPRTTRAQSMDVLSSQANIAGYKAVLQAASIYPKYFPMLMTAAGSIAPAKVLILGAGVAGLQAVATARRLGAASDRSTMSSPMTAPKLGPWVYS